MCCPHKLGRFKQVYGNMHRHIISHPQFLRESNVGELGALTFVFLAMDSGPDKQAVIDYLSSRSISSSIQELISSEHQMVF